jgi:hypothetical protein
VRLWVALSWTGRGLGKVAAPRMSVPLLAMAGLGTLLPGLPSMGTFTSALTSQLAIPIVAVMLVVVGFLITPATIRPVAARTAVVLAGTTVLPGLGVYVYGELVGLDSVVGISLVSVAMSSSNVVWLELMRGRGTAIDIAGGTAACAVNTGPLLPLLLVAAWGYAHHIVVPWRSALDALGPLAAGATAGTVLDALAVAGLVRPARLAQARQTARQTIIPFLTVVFTAGLGYRISLSAAGHQLLLGAVVGILSPLQRDPDPLRCSRSGNNSMITAWRVGPRTAQNPW